MRHFLSSIFVRIYSKFFAVAFQPFWTQHLHNYPQNIALQQKQYFICQQQPQSTMLRTIMVLCKGALFMLPVPRLVKPIHRKEKAV